MATKGDSSSNATRNQLIRTDQQFHVFLMKLKVLPVVDELFKN